ncbi:catalase family protein [Deinococcus sp. Marseille-Q6407]|uniref:catalase family protein n=1 Tax=Deinococcus sp. Marseille-Q6407 TaxID=2969223 RepID=UPI0021C20A3E|nr:catalase family protein [Deinococcus sp. Marseille-Q6407]
MNYVKYTPEVEVKQPGEDEKINEVVRLMHEANVKAFDKHRHAIRDAHAKQHGTVVGTLEIPELPEHLAQGLFAKPASYPVVIRFSSAPGEIRDDSVPVPHGMAIKVIGVPGKKILPDHQDEVTQDFLMVTMPVIPFGTVDEYLKMQNVIALQDGASEESQRAFAAVARGGQKVLGLLGISDPTLDGIAAENEHLLGQTYHTMAAIRYGDYIAKLSAAPLSSEVKALEGQIIDTTKNASAQRDALVDFFHKNSAEYELRAQLCTDLDKMPVEDGSVEWDEKLSPQQAIARLVIPKQEAYSPERRVFSDDKLSFNPWHALPEHQPLGSIMRVRIKAYESSTAFRHDMNVQPRVEPKDISEIPD